jgi:hypothetical protein
MEVVDWLQIIIVPVALLWAYTRYSKRRAVTYSVANAAVNWVDCIVTSEHSKSFVVSYGYSVNGVRHFGTFTLQASDSAPCLITTRILKSSGVSTPLAIVSASITGHRFLTSTGFTSHVLWVAFRVPLIAAFLLNIPLLFIRFLVILSGS